MSWVKVPCKEISLDFYYNNLFTHSFIYVFLPGVGGGHCRACSDDGTSNRPFGGQCLNPLKERPSGQNRSQGAKDPPQPPSHPAPGHIIQRTLRLCGWDEEGSVLCSWISKSSGTRVPGTSPESRDSHPSLGSPQARDQSSPLHHLWTHLLPVGCPC